MKIKDIKKATSDDTEVLVQVEVNDPIYKTIYKGDVKSIPKSLEEADVSETAFSVREQCPSVTIVEEPEIVEPEIDF